MSNIKKFVQYVNEASEPETDKETLYSDREGSFDPKKRKELLSDPVLAPLPEPNKNPAEQGKHLAKGGTLAVAAWQKKLVDAGFSVGPKGIDGAWGPDTQAAYVKYCAKRKIKKMNQTPASYAKRAAAKVSSTTSTSPKEVTCDGNRNDKHGADSHDDWHMINNIPYDEKEFKLAVRNWIDSDLKPYAKEDLPAHLPKNANMIISQEAARRKKEGDSLNTIKDVPFLKGDKTKAPVNDPNRVKRLDNLKDIPDYDKLDGRGLGGR